jgi:hypothetical protein
MRPNPVPDQKNCGPDENGGRAFCENEGARMTMTQISEIIQKWMGWCPNAQTIRSSSAILSTPPVSLHSVEPDGGPGGSGRISRGINLALGSIKSLIQNKSLLWFSFLTGLVVLFMIASETFYIANLEIITPLLIGIPVMDSIWVFDIRLFLLQVISIFCIDLLLAGLILSISPANTGRPATVREGLSGAWKNKGPLAVLAVIMALLGTALFEIAIQNPFVGHFLFTALMNVFYLPYAYYIPDAISSALFFICIALFINFLLFVLTLFVLPIIVLENKNLPAALTGSISLMKGLWREIIGCILVFGAIAIGVSLISVLIGMTPAFVNYDYDFFHSRGKMLMIIICFLYVIGWWILMTIGSTAVGIAIRNLYSFGKTGRMPDKFLES